jgi:predicted AAA+ superfamily ATPase
MQKIINRAIQPILEKWLFRGKILIIYGARQVGKTTLCKSLMANLGMQDAMYFNCEIQSIQLGLSNNEPQALKRFIGTKKMIVLDEAQCVSNIGLVLKLLIDTFPDMQIIATGSSSFDLANRAAEPLTGRALQFVLYPLAYQELSQVYHPMALKAHLPYLLRFGLYPEVAFASDEDARVLLDSLSSSYLFKDILMYENIKRSDVLVNLLRLLALQVGNLVSHHELANQLKISAATVERYIDLLEKSFVIFRLMPFSRNLRNEIGKKNKIFFYDIGIRNSIIQQYQPLEMRMDKGAIWENFIIVERLKWLQANGLRPNCYFWRTTEQVEIDYLEDADGQLNAFEFKWLDKKTKAPSAFTTHYPDATFKAIDTENFENFICGI